MDAARRRQEARRRRLLQDPEERLKRIRDLKNHAAEPETKPEDVPLGTQLPSPTVDKVSDLQEEPAAVEAYSSTDLAQHHVHPKVKPPSTSETSKLSQRPTQTSSNLWTLITNILIEQFLSVGSETSPKASSYRTITVSLVAFMFRLMLGIDWITALTGQSMVLVFLVVYLSWLIIFEKVNISTTRSIIVLLFNIFQDFAVYLFTFVVTNLLLSSVFRIDDPSKPLSET